MVPCEPVEPSFVALSPRRYKCGMSTRPMLSPADWSKDWEEVIGTDYAVFIDE
jgi:hypothetical protein